MSLYLIRILLVPHLGCIYGGFLEWRFPPKSPKLSIWIGIPIINQPDYWTPPYKHCILAMFTTFMVSKKISPLAYYPSMTDVSAGRYKVMTPYKLTSWPLMAPHTCNILCVYVYYIYIYLHTHIHIFGKYIHIYLHIYIYIYVYIISRYWIYIYIICVSKINPTVNPWTNLI